MRAWPTIIRERLTSSEEVPSRQGKDKTVKSFLPLLKHLLSVLGIVLVAGVSEIKRIWPMPPEKLTV